MTFLEQRLELGLNYGASYGPRFNTAIATASNGVEQRRAIWSQPLITIQLGDRRVNESELNYLLAFHASVKGAFAGFRIRDWSDYRSGLTAIGTGDGSLQSWQLVKRYTVDTVTVTRPITKPIDGTLKVYVEGAEALTGWSCDYSSGVLFTELTGAIIVDFQFDVPVRFEQDKIDFTYEAGRSGRKLFTMAPLTCVELRLEPTIYPPLDTLPTAIAETFDLGYDFGTLGGPSFNTAISSNAAEFESRKSYWANAKGSWDIGDRGLLRSELDYFISLFRCARGMAIPFSFKDWQDETTKLVRFAEDRISFRFDAFRSTDEEVIFNLGGVAIEQIRTLKIDPETYVITFIDTTSLSQFEIDNINTAINQLRPLLASTVYGTEALASKYVKTPINKGDERYMLWPASDYRDNVSEPKKYLFLAFVDESNQQVGIGETTDSSYHYVPRNVGVEPTNLWTADFNTFNAVYPDFAIFNYLIFSPTGSPSLPSEDAFNPHIIDVVAGNNGYPAMGGYNFAAKPYWDESASGQDIYDAIIEFIS